MSTYQYQPLGSEFSNVRLLTLQPGQWDSEIHCSLREARLDSDPYEALSYVWGDANDLCTIHLENCTHHVTTNLAKALRYLRYADETRVFWVDALCINQSDLKEREEQVKQMFSIYKKASRVVSWTGEATEDSHQAIEIIRAAGVFMEAMDDGKYDDEIEAIQEDDPTVQTGAALFKRLGFSVAEHNWDPTWKFLERPYWSRVWIVQELAADRILRKSHGVIMCGKDTIPRRYYDYTYTMIIFIMMGDPNYEADTGEVVEPLKSMLLRGSHPPGLTMIQALSSCFGEKVDKGGLEFLLRVTKRFQASDPRDKIYAILGLAPERYRRVTPDYTVPLGGP